MLTMYPACFFKEENGYSVIFPDFNHLATCGDNFNHAMVMAVDCLAGYIYWCQQDGDFIPLPSQISDIDVVQVAKDIYDDEYEDTLVEECVINMVSVDVEAYAKENFEKSVRKTLTIPAWLNKVALEMDINFSQTLQEALIAKVKLK